MTCLTREYLTEEEDTELVDNCILKEIATLDWCNGISSVILTLESGERLLFRTSEWATIDLIVPGKKPIQILTSYPQGEL